MARRKLPEYIAKKLLFQQLEVPYHGITIEELEERELAKLDVLDKTKSYVVKVDQGIKKRGKAGLIGVKVSPYKIKSYLKDFALKGYSRFLVEDFIEHDQKGEKYLSLERTRDGIVIRYSLKGGVDIEENQDEVKTTVIVRHPEEDSTLGVNKVHPSQKRGSFFSGKQSNKSKEIASSSRNVDSPRNDDGVGDDKVKQVAAFLGLSPIFLSRLITFFQEQYISFLEINPLLIGEGEQRASIYILDLAVEVDSAGEFFVKNSWSAKDFVEAPSASGETEEEKVIRQLKENSQASLTLNVLNPNGSIFTMLSGGGASITIADEAYNRGYGKELANYADYSGNPNQEETYLYTKQLLRLLLRSTAYKKALLVAGGVANFTDVRVTFRGILQALAEESEKLQKQQIKIFVRRGGPNQIEGLAMMKDFLTQNNLYGGVWDQTMVLTDVVNKAIEYIA